MELIVLLSCFFSYCASGRIFRAEAFFMKTKEGRRSDIVAALSRTVHYKTYVSHSFASTIRKYSAFKFNLEIAQKVQFLAT